MDISDMLTSIFSPGVQYNANLKSMGLDPTSPQLIANLQGKLSALQNSTPEDDAESGKSVKLGAATQNQNQQKLLQDMLDYYSKQQGKK